MTGPALPGVHVDVDLADAIRQAPRCEVDHAGRACEFPASWIGCTRGHCHEHANLFCNGHQHLFARCLVHCRDCHQRVTLTWERL